MDTLNLVVPWGIKKTFHPIIARIDEHGELIGPPLRGIRKYRGAQIRRKLREETAGKAFSKTEWSTLLLEYNFQCLRCGTQKKIVADHIKPLFFGGKNSIDNIQPLCYACNFWKGLKTIDFRPTYMIEII